VVEQAGPGRDSPTESLRFFKNRPTPPHLRPLRRETPSHPGDLVRIVRLVRTFLQEQELKGQGVEGTDGAITIANMES
jgi:hypothetical protein